MNDARSPVVLLDGAHIQPVNVSLREPTLDDVFLDLTGRPSDVNENKQVA
jgi:hypothetical protein